MSKEKPVVTIFKDGSVLLPDTVELDDKREDNRGRAATFTAELHQSEPPYKAAFKDLRVGQWVALFDEHHARAGKIVEQRTWDPRPFVVIPFPQSDGATGFEIGRRACDRGEVVILRDAPAPPVTVRREDLDRARVLLDHLPSDYGPRFYGDLQPIVRDLIDNAETEPSP